MRWSALLVLPAVLVLAAGAVACGGGGGTPPASPTPMEAAASPTPAPTATPAPSPTPLGGAVPEGSQRHTTANIQIDLPQTWDTFDPTEETVDAILEAVRNLNPEFASVAEQGLMQVGTEIFAFDTESVEFLNNLRVARGESPLPATVPMLLFQIESQLADLGISVLSTDSALTIGGLQTGRIDYSVSAGPFEVRGVQYLVFPDPNVTFFLTFSTIADDFDRLAPLFEQMAQSFRVLEPG